jgi:pilus assembly protein CpaC
MMRRSHLARPYRTHGLLSLIWLLLLALPALAQQATQVAVGEGRILRMPRDVTQVFVADQAVADVQVVSPRVVYVYGRRIGQTTVHAVDNADGVVATYVVRVERSAAAPQAAVPTRRTGVTMEFVGDRLMMQGPVRDVSEALEVEATGRAYSSPGTRPLDRTRLGGSQQVMLRVRFAETSRNDLERLGINWSVVANPGNFVVSLLTGGLLRGFDPNEQFGLLGAGFRDPRGSAR